MYAKQSRFLIFFLIFLTHCAKTESRVKTKYFYSDGENIRDSEGRIILLRGVNLSSAHKQRDKETGEFFPKWLTEYVFEEIASLGMNSIRFLVEWELTTVSDYLDKYTIMCIICVCIQ